MKTCILKPINTFGQHEEQPLLQTHIVPHARTLRKAREQVKWMVYVVGENSTLVIPGLAFMVFGLMLG